MQASPQKVMQWSPQQSTFLEWAFEGKGSCILEAVAGAGKSSVLLAAAAGIAGQTLMLAFNKAIAVELDAKLKARGIDWKRAQAATVHSAGFKAYRKSFPKVEVNEHKVANICAQAIAMQTIPATVAPFSAIVCKLVSLAKQTGVGLVEEIGNAAVWLDIIEHFDLLDDENAEKQVGAIVKAAQQLLVKSNGKTDVIDFDDMVYMPLLLKVRFYQFDNVMVDEAQDTNTVRRMLVRALLKPTGRLVAVGDRAQAIYGFSGADSDSLDRIASDFGCTRLPLTITYRCPKAVVRFTHQWVSHIEAHDSAPEGKVSKSTFEAFMRRDDLNGESAILCRNTKPLVSAAFALIRSKIPCRIEGREIGDGLRKLATRWNGVTTINALRDRLELYRDREVRKAKAKRLDARVQQVEDQVDTLGVIMDSCKQEGRHHVTDVTAYIDRLFGDQVSGMLTLSTIHRSKGREWKRVFWLDRLNTCPSRHATQDWEVVAERNLQYVAATRAVEELIDLDMPNPTRKKAIETSNLITKLTAAA